MHEHAGDLAQRPRALRFRIRCVKEELALSATEVGCRETVDERVNGVLVAPRDPEALAEAMESFLRRPDLIPAMARASRGKAERFDSVAAVRRTMLGVVGIE